MRPTEFRQTRQLLRLTQDQLAERLRTTRRSIIRYEDEGMSGADAGLLWNRWRHGRDQEARARLLAYNEADCVNLEPLADLFFCQMVQRHGFPTPEVPKTVRADIARVDGQYQPSDDQPVALLAPWYLVPLESKSAP